MPPAISERADTEMNLWNYCRDGVCRQVCRWSTTTRYCEPCSRGKGSATKIWKVVLQTWGKAQSNSWSIRGTRVFDHHWHSFMARSLASLNSNFIKYSEEDEGSICDPWTFRWDCHWQWYIFYWHRIPTVCDTKWDLTHQGKRPTTHHQTVSLSEQFSCSMMQWTNCQLPQ